LYCYILYILYIVLCFFIKKNIKKFINSAKQKKQKNNFLPQKIESPPKKNPKG